MKDNDVKGGRRVVWSPQERQAEFMQRGEYEALYGGAAGGGKSDALLAEALRQADKACYRGIIFRKTYPQLTELEDRSQTLYKGAYPAARYGENRELFSCLFGKDERKLKPVKDNRNKRHRVTAGYGDSNGSAGG